MSTLQQEIEQFLFREARLLDSRDWDNWLNCYHPEVEYWMPAWTDHDQLTTDPQREISLIYYPNRDGLEDRIYRIKTERSAASTPEPRTTHMLSNIEILNHESDSVTICYNWCTLSHRYQKTDNYFGHNTLVLHKGENGWQIRRKTVQLNNDYISHVIDIYHI